MELNYKKKTSCLFYESFQEAIKKMPPEQALRAYIDVIDYGLYGKEPENVEAGSSFDIMFTMAKPLMDIAKEKRKNGKKGGKPKNASSNQPTNYNSNPLVRNDNVSQQMNYNQPVNKQPIYEDDLPF